jgi:hypothetical protein
VGREKIMSSIDFIIWLSLIGTPLSAALAWWLWSRRNRSLANPWRRRFAMTGLVAASANAAMYYVWLSCRVAAGGTPLIWRFKDALGAFAGYLVLLALAGAIAGKGAARVPIVVCALLGFMNWVPIVIL